MGHCTGIAAEGLRVRGGLQSGSVRAMVADLGAGERPGQREDRHSIHHLGAVIWHSNGGAVHEEELLGQLGGSSRGAERSE